MSNQSFLASTLQIGDSNEINGLARVLAVQRQREVFFSIEGDFSLFKIFSYPLSPPPIYEPLTIHTTSPNPIIKVGLNDVTCAQYLSIYAYWKYRTYSIETRVLHIRQIETVDEPITQYWRGGGIKDARNCWSRANYKHWWRKCSIW